MKLVEISALATDSDLVLWQASCETIAHQIALKMARKEGGLMEILNAVVASIPRKTDMFRNSAISSKPQLESAYKSVVESIVKILPDLVENGWKKSPDYKKHVVVDVFSILDESDAIKVFHLGKESRAITEQDVEEYFEIFDKKLDRLLAYGKPQFEATTNELTRGKYANLCVEVLVAIGTATGNAQKITEFFEKQNWKVSKMWVTRIPELFEQITILYDYATLFDIAMSLEGFPLRKVFLARQFACQAMVNCFVTMALGTKYKVRERIEKEVEKPTRFVGHVAELGHEAILVKLSPKAVQSVEDSRRRLEAETIERLRKCGYLENLGCPPDELVQAQIESIREILPHFNKEFIHLALRHFSYDSEVTLASLLSRENLPIELLRLESVELKAGVGSGELPPLDFTASDEIEKSIRAEKLAADEEQRKRNEQKAPMSLFSLAPILTERPPTPPDSAAELRARAELYRSTVLTKLKKIKAESSEASSERLAADAENLVPMLTSKKYSALNSLKISEADKVAIRPTYDKYRYETPNEESGVYDDEYDDEFDGREFNVERLNQELETSSEEDDAETAVPIPSGPPRGGGRGRGRGGRGGASSTDGYTGGRDRQQKERHKSDFKQRGADRKKRGAY